MEEIRCGLPPGFSPTKNCTLGFLVISDVMQAFKQVCEAGKSNVVARRMRVVWL